MSDIHGELAAFVRRLPDLLEKHPIGSWALIHAGEVVDVLPDFGAVLAAGYDRFGLGPFLTQEIRPDPIAMRWLAEYDAAEAEYASWHPVMADASDEREDFHGLVDRLSDLLTRSVNAIRGDPPPHTLWSWHDLPDLCAKTAGALRYYKDECTGAEPSLSVFHRMVEAAFISMVDDVFGIAPSPAPAEANTEYVLHYRHKGQVWALNFFAIDDVDAEHKIQSLRTTLELKGRLLGRGDTLEEAAQAAAQSDATELVTRLAARPQSNIVCGMCDCTPEQQAACRDRKAP